MWRKFFAQSHLGLLTADAKKRRRRKGPDKKKGFASTISVVEC